MYIWEFTKNFSLIYIEGFGVVYEGTKKECELYFNNLVNDYVARNGVFNISY